MLQHRHHVAEPGALPATPQPAQFTTVASVVLVVLSCVVVMVVFVGCIVVVVVVVDVVAVVVVVVEFVGGVVVVVGIGTVVVTVVGLVVDIIDVVDCECTTLAIATNTTTNKQVILFLKYFFFFQHFTLLFPISTIMLQLHHLHRQHHCFSHLELPSRRLRPPRPSQTDSFRAIVIPWPAQQRWPPERLRY